MIDYIKGNEKYLTTNFGSLKSSFKSLSEFPHELITWTKSFLQWLPENISSEYQRIPPHVGYILMKVMRSEKIQLYKIRESIDCQLE